MSENLASKNFHERVVLQKKIFSGGNFHYRITRANHKAVKFCVYPVGYLPKSAVVTVLKDASTKCLPPINAPINRAGPRVLKYKGA